MLKVSHATLITLSGCIWLAAGCFLLPLGLNLVVSSLLLENAAEPHPVLNFLSPYVGGIDSAALTWIAFALLIGYVKGTKVFKKSVIRSVERIASLPNPANISNLYTPAYLILLAIMISLGILLRYTTQDIRGGVDIIVGSALIHGAMFYFRQAWQARRATNS